MIDIAVHATGGVKVPGQKLTCLEIIQTFKKHLMELKGRFKVRVFL